MSVTKLDAEDNTPIAGAVFGLYADEDIKNVAGKVIIEKGTLLEKATSDENGKIAFVKDYPFAKYVARELVKPAGYVTNERQKVQITVTKTDSETKEALEGAVFGLFAKEDIVNKDGKVIVKADTQIERTVTGKDGKVLDTLTTDKNGHAESKELPICTYNEDGSFKEDIHYTVVETKAADGYILDETAHDVTLRYDDNAPDVVVTTLKLINVPTEPKLPQTGDNANPLLYLGIGALALITGVGVGLRGRKKKNKQ
nr:SpaA isopeptide-forming pilin-related protein [Agathobacter rectalis]